MDASSPPSVVSLTDIHAARRRIAPYAHCTPVLTSTSLNKVSGRQLFFKCENFQKVGAFKFRGACNAVLSLPDEEASYGVVTHSSGNHAQALALAAKIRGIEAHIVMPANAPLVKRRAVEGYGATVYECASTLQARETTTELIMQQTGAVLIHPYNDARIIAGQATCALELIEQTEQTPVDAIVAPIGGGGLMSGTCCAAAGAPDYSVRIIGAEPAGADDAAQSLAARELIPQTNPKTIADGLLTSLGSLTWPIVRDHVERIITVSDEEILNAMRLIWERMKILIEPSSATVLAAVLSSEFGSLEGLNRIGLILSGGNVDLDRLPWLP